MVNWRMNRWAMRREKTGKVHTSQCSAWPYVQLPADQPGLLLQHPELYQTQAAADTWQELLSCRETKEGLGKNRGSLGEQQEAGSVGKSQVLLVPTCAGMLQRHICAS